MLKKLQNQLRPANAVSFNELRSLTRIPDKMDFKTEMQHIYDFQMGFTLQADVLFMPQAKFGFNKILVVVDTHTKQCDAVALKNEDSATIVKAFKTVFQRGILHKPKMFEFDNGTGFKGDVIKYCKDNDIHYRYAATNRHSQQALVESKNHVVGKFLYSFINQEELANLNEAERLNALKANPVAHVKVKLVTDWYKSEAHFRSIIDFINQNTEGIVYNDQLQDTPMYSKKNEVLLGVGTMVRTLLNHPVEIGTNARTHGNFRSSDVRWSRQIKAITWVVLKPSQPPEYKVGSEKVLYTKQQLQVITPSNRGFA